MVAEQGQRQARAIRSAEQIDLVIAKRLAQIGDILRNHRAPKHTQVEMLVID